jgi:hypothetical protein
MPPTARKKKTFLVKNKGTSTTKGTLKTTTKGTLKPTTKTANNNALSLSSSNKRREGIVFHPLAFGKETNKIHTLFKKFTDFTNVTKITNSATVLKNGFVVRIQLEKQFDEYSYSTCFLLKSVQKANNKGDDLYYEYIAGRVINRFAERFPCFVETYNLYQYTSAKEFNLGLQFHSQSELQRDTLTFCDILKGLKRLQKTAIEDACRTPSYLALSLQHFDNVSLPLIDHVRHRQFVDMDLYFVLLQIYLPLSHLSGHFVHNDLHLRSVLLHEPSNRMHIRFVYHIGGNTEIRFVSRFVAKMVDYGRSFFDFENKTMFGNTRQLVKQATLCRLAKREEDEAADLRLAHILFVELARMKTPIVSDLAAFFHEYTSFQDFLTDAKVKITASVFCAFLLEKFSSYGEMNRGDPAYKEENVMGELHVWLGEDYKAMQYIPLQKDDLFRSVNDDDMEDGFES